MFGHSDGGATTAHAMHTGPRIAAGVNLDGTLWTPEAAAASNRPLLLFGKKDLDPFQATTWAAFRANHHGLTRQLHLNGSTHATFEALAVVCAYVNAYFDTYLRHRDSPLLDGPSAHYPEIRFAP